MRAAYYRDRHVSLYAGDAIDVLAELPDASVDCVVTSPPYWGMRDYLADLRTDGTEPDKADDTENQRSPRCGAQREDRQYGREATVEGYVQQLRAVFTHLRRVLADTGTVWLNLGDTYSANPPGRTRDPMRTSGLSGASTAVLRESVRRAKTPPGKGMPRKNLLGIPWRVAFALQADGWIVRNAIIWHKPNAMPEPVRDRLSTRYEILFLLVKQQKYYFDLDAIREPLAEDTHQCRHRETWKASPDGGTYRDTGAGGPRGKNPGDVWSIPTRPLKAAHFAAFPVDLPLRAIAAGCPPGGLVLDPFSGAATTGMASRQLDRCYIGIDINPHFHAIGLARLGLTPSETDEDEEEQGRAA